MMAENGFLGMFVPEEYGGVGYTILDYVVALEEICYADAGVGTIMSVNNSLVCWPIFSFGNDEQKQRYDADATPSYGTDTLEQFFERVARDGMAGQDLGDAALF